MAESRFYRALLKLFPREFRGDFGEQMEADFQDQREDERQRGARRGSVRLWTRTVGDILRRAPAEHFEILRRDAGYALRLFRRNPGFAAAVVLTLAIGVGSTTAVFTLADPMLFRPLPYPDSDRVVEFYARANGKGTYIHLPDFVRAESSTGAFEAVAMVGVGPGIGRIDGLEQEPFAYGVTRRFFDVVKVRPFIGREFLPQEYGTYGTHDAAIVTFGFWQRAFGGRADILSQTLSLTGPQARRLRIVGVLPADFFVPDDVNRAPDLLVADAPDLSRQGSPNRLAWPIARLAPGVSMQAATGELQAVFKETEREYPQFVQGRQAGLRTLREGLFGPTRTPLLMLLGATGCVLLLACANLAHLFMARLQARQREFGVRLAIGAGRGRLVRLLVMEATVFAIAGGAASLVFARWTFDLIMSRTPEFVHVYRLLPAGLDARVMAFAVALAGVALAIFGVLPALRASRLDIRGSLLNGGAATATRHRLTSDAALILVQCAVALTLLVTGALLVRSFYKLAYQPLGFEPHAVRTVDVETPGPRLDEQASAAQVRRLYEHLRERLRVPITLADGWPAQTLPAGVSRREGADDGPRPVAYSVAGTFFDVFRIRLVSGRLMTEAEAVRDAPVAVIDRRAADKLWPGEDAIGREVLDQKGTGRTVVGIVETLRTGLVADESDGIAFLPLRTARSIGLAYRDPDRAVSEAQLRALVQEVAPGATVMARPFRPFERTLGQPRFLALLLGALGLVAVALTIVGIFGVVNHEVARRVREVGIRLACGADAGHIRRLILQRALAPAVLGILVGAGVSLWWTPTLRSLLVGLEPDDAATFALAATVVLATVLASSLLPAWRASRVDPVIALRQD